MKKYPIYISVATFVLGVILGAVIFSGNSNLFRGSLGSIQKITKGTPSAVRNVYNLLPQVFNDPSGHNEKCSLLKKFVDEGRLTSSINAGRGTYAQWQECQDYHRAATFSPAEWTCAADYWLRLSGITSDTHPSMSGKSEAVCYSNFPSSLKSPTRSRCAEDVPLLREVRPEYIAPTAKAELILCERLYRGL